MKPKTFSYKRWLPIFTRFLTEAFSIATKPSGCFPTARTLPFFGGYNNLEFTKAGTSKGTGLLFLCRYLNIPQEETLAIGDTQNDLDIIQTAAIGVAMDNAIPEVKKKPPTLSLSRMKKTALPMRFVILSLATDDAAAGNIFTIVKNYCLSRRYCPDRLLKFTADLILSRSSHNTSAPTV